MKILGKRLKEARENAGFKQIEAAKQLGISNGTLSGYERDYRDPDTEILHKMAVLYDVDADWLIGKSNTKKVEKDIKRTIVDKIATEFPDAELMFHDLANMTTEQLEEVYEFIKFKRSRNN